MTTRLPDPAVVVLVGASGAGKSTWAAEHFRSVEVVSSDQLRAVVGTGPHDQQASKDAFAVLEQIVTARTSRRLTTVIDSTGLDRRRRLGYLAAARRAELPAVVVVVDTDAALCRRRNAERERRVPAAVLSAQLAQLTSTVALIEQEGWDVVVRVGQAAPPPPQAAPEPPPAVAARRSRLRVVLQLSRFPWGEDPAAWLRQVALRAHEIGFDGIALMDHLIQIPQVDRAWEPIPQPWVTLGLLAALDTDLRLGTLVSPVTLHRPGVLAKTVATLDVLSRGRAFCGLGAGWWEREHLAYGVPFPSAAQRLDQVETTIETMRALWAPGTKAYQGRRVALPETTCYPRPTGPVPILVGGTGDRTLRVAAQLADGCNVPARLDTLPSQLALLQRHRAAVGRSVAEVEVTVLDVPVIGTDRDDTAARVERLRGRAAGAAFAQRHHAGTAAEHVRRYAELADLGVGTVFLALPDLAGADDLERCRDLVTAAHAG